MSHRVRRIVLSIAVLPLVMLVGLRSVWASYACRVDNEVRAKCCCPKKADTERSPWDDAPRIDPGCCCDVTSGESASAPQAREADRLRADDAVLVPVAIEPAFVATMYTTRVPARAERARPPPFAVPTFLANRVILR